MAVSTGEIAERTGDYHCEHCSFVVHLLKGQKIPPCPNGHHTFDVRNPEKIK